MMTGILRIMVRLIEARFTLCLPFRSAHLAPSVFAVHDSQYGSTSLSRTRARNTWF